MKYATSGLSRHDTGNVPKTAAQFHDENENRTIKDLSLERSSEVGNIKAHCSEKKRQIIRSFQGYEQTSFSFLSFER